MTYGEIYKKAVGILTDSGCNSPDYDVRCLLEYHFALDRMSFLRERNSIADSRKETDFFRDIQKRAEGYPLQYLLKGWSFMDCELSVGEGVLIPRDDTEVCVRECMRLIDEKGMTKPVIIDLCSGSGAIAIALAKKYPQAHIFAVEFSKRSYEFLCENIDRNETRNVTALNKDVFEGYIEYEDGYFDVIISNPPYIRTAEIPALQKEVQFEPQMALDGGEDGLEFYRVISEKWLPKLKSGGIVSVEIGEEQGEAVSSMLRMAGIENIQVLKDLGGLDRTIAGQKN
ncbi:MAG: peptide chain release factor N(5)-glutamine methyltransferase [Clostridia bacterium]|nr:peptide chain release factor N(5)-glutamine methyltransferase [Clostridia bacterium]